MTGLVRYVRTIQASDRSRGTSWLGRNHDARLASHTKRYIPHNKLMNMCGRDQQWTGKWTLTKNICGWKCAAGSPPKAVKDVPGVVAGPQGQMVPVCSLLGYGRPSSIRINSSTQLSHRYRKDIDCVLLMFFCK